MHSLGSAMDEPEDLLQLILSMTDKGFFNELFSQGLSKDPGSLKQWFDSKAGTFGGQSAVKVVRNLIGHADKFECQNLEEIPKLDLGNMYNFFESMLKLNGHRLEVNNDLMGFKTPKVWGRQYGIRRRYDSLSLSDEELMIELSEMYDYVPKTAREVNWDSSFVLDEGTLLPKLKAQLDEKIKELDLPYEQVTYSLVATFLPSNVWQN